MKAKLTMRERFEAFDAAHPDVWALFVAWTLAWIKKLPYRRTSADSVYHRIRWEAGTHQWQKGYSLPNEFTPFYARKFMKEFPQHDGVFELRKSQADGDDGDDGQLEMVW